MYRSLSSQISVRMKPGLERHCTTIAINQWHRRSSGNVLASYQAHRLTINPLYITLFIASQFPLYIVFSIPSPPLYQTILKNDLINIFSLSIIVIQDIFRFKQSLIENSVLGRFVKLRWQPWPDCKSSGFNIRCTTSK